MGQQERLCGVKLVGLCCENDEDNSFPFLYVCLFKYKGKSVFPIKF